jgi:folate-binding protein YgfZ
MDDTVVPWEAGIDHAIHLNKGCYVGQEVIARMEYLGRVSRKLVALVMEGDKVPAVGGEVGHDGENVGRVTSACFGPTVGKPLALAYVKYDHSDAGTTLVVEAGGEALPATVTQPPMAGETPPPKGSRG